MAMNVDKTSAKACQSEIAVKAKIATAAMCGAIVSSLGCGAGTPVPNDQFAAAQADVGRAQAEGAPEVPRAKLHLQLAQEDLQRAKQLMGTDNDRAASLCAVARSEAQLASSLSLQTRAENQARSEEAEAQKVGR
jgi:hypothetical protein